MFISKNIKIIRLYLWRLSWKEVSKRKKSTFHRLELKQISIISSKSLVALVRFSFIHLRWNLSSIILCDRSYTNSKDNGNYKQKWLYCLPVKAKLQQGGERNRRPRGYKNTKAVLLAEHDWYKRWHVVGYKGKPMSRTFEDWQSLLRIIQPWSASNT